MTRKQLIDNINNIEKELNVRDWVVKEIDIWPIFKMILFFQLFNEKLATKNSKSIKGVIKKIFKRIGFELNKINIFNSLYRNEYEKVDYLFSGASTYRSHINGLSIDKFNDPIADNLELHGLTCTLFEYTKISSKKLYKPLRVKDATKLYQKYNKKYLNNNDLSESTQKEINDICKIFDLNFSKILNKLLNDLNSTLVWKSVWSEILDKTKPIMTFGICYYNVNMFGLVLASRERKIKFVDIQHGGQGQLHALYYFNNEHITQLNTIPNIFWVWNEIEKNNIVKWLKDEKRIIIGGNPWLNFETINNNSKVDSELKHIVYTLQVKTKPYFPPLILDAIKNTPEDYIWHIRYHPRMNNDDILEIKNEIEKINSSRIYNLEESNKVSLPALLNSAYIHISRFSGSILEADIINVPYNIIIDTIGAEIYQELISDSRAIFIESDETQLFQRIKNFKENENKKIKAEYLDYNTIINGIEK